MKSNAKIYQFPSSKKEREQIRKNKIDTRLIIVGKLKQLTGLALVISLVGFFSTNYKLFMKDNMKVLSQYTNMSKADSDADLSVINFSSGNFDDVALFGTGLAVSDKDSLYVSKPGNVTQLQLQLSYTNPLVEVSSKYILAYDRGGNEITVTNALAPVNSFTVESPILSASISESELITVVTDEAGYKTAAIVYNINGEQMYKWSSSEYYIMSAKVSDNGKKLVATGFKQQDTTLVSSVLFFDLDKDSVQKTVDMNNQLSVNLFFLNNDTLAVLCDGCLYIMDGNGNILFEKYYSTSDFISYSVSENNLAIALKSYSKDARTDIFIIDSKGNCSEPLRVTEEVSSISLNGTILGVLTSDSLVVYDKSLSPLYSYKDSKGGKRVIITEQGNAYIIYSKYAKIVRYSDEVANGGTQ